MQVNSLGPIALGWRRGAGVLDTALFDVDNVLKILSCVKTSMELA